MSRFVFAFVLGLAAGPAAASSYYVSPGGDDLHAGTTPASAWKTIARVNAATLAPGDSVRFEGGQSFAGNLALDPADAGSLATRVTIGSYGAGRATLTHATGAGVTIHNAGGFRIEHLVVQGPGRLNAAGTYGIYVLADAAGGVKYDGIDLRDVEVRENYEPGIYVLSNHTSDPGFRHVLVEGCEVHDNGRNGMVTQGVFHTAAGDPFTAHSDVVVRDCSFHHNSGIPGQSSHSGSGLILSSVDGGLVEFCEGYENGALNDAPGGGPVGLWTWESKNVIFQFNESHHNRTQGGDGGGFDIDGGCIQCVMQYNWSHDNEGSGFGVYQFDGAHTYRDNVIRYNVTQNEGTAGIHFWATNSSGGIQRTQVYGNTVYVGAGQGAAAIEDIDVHKNFVFQTKVWNNLFVGAANKKLIDIPKPTGVWDFRGNCYWSYNDADVTLNWNHASYASLAALRAATGQETGTGWQVDPMLTAPGLGATIGDPHQLAQLAAYRLQPGSPMIDNGLDLAALFAVDPGPRDFYGAALPAGAGLDVGAHEFDGVVGVAASPGRLALGASAPNPFVTASTIAFELRSQADVALVVFDARGARVRTLVEGPRAAGRHVATWDGRDATGAAVPAGVYFVELASSGQRVRTKLVRL